MQQTTGAVRAMAHKYATVPMLSRTHGQVTARCVVFVLVFVCTCVRAYMRGRSCVCLHVWLCRVRGWGTCGTADVRV